MARRARSLAGAASGFTHQAHDLKKIAAVGIGPIPGRARQARLMAVRHRSAVIYSARPRRQVRRFPWTPTSGLVVELCGGARTGDIGLVRSSAKRARPACRIEALTARARLLEAVPRCITAEARPESRSTACSRGARRQRRAETGRGGVGQ